MSPEFVERMLWAIVGAVLASVLIVWNMWYLQERRLQNCVRDVKSVSERISGYQEGIAEEVRRKQTEDKGTQELVRSLNDHVLTDKDRIAGLEQQVKQLTVQLSNVQKPAPVEKKPKQNALSGLHDMFNSFDHVADAKPKIEPASVQPEAKVDKPVELPTPTAPEEDVPLEIPTTTPTKKATWKPGSWFK
jgi:hypothetical protein